MNRAKYELQDNKGEIGKLRKEEDLREFRQEKNNQIIAELERSEADLKSKIRTLGDQNTQQLRRNTELNSMVTNILI